MYMYTYTYVYVYMDFYFSQTSLKLSRLCHDWKRASRRWRLGYSLCPHATLCSLIKIYLDISCFQALEVEQEQKLAWTDPKEKSCVGGSESAL